MAGIKAHKLVTWERDEKELERAWSKVRTEKKISDRKTEPDGCVVQPVRKSSERHDITSLRVVYDVTGCVCEYDGGKVKERRHYRVGNVGWVESEGQNGCGVSSRFSEVIIVRCMLWWIDHYWGEKSTQATGQQAKTHKEVIGNTPCNEGFPGPRSRIKL